MANEPDQMENPGELAVLVEAKRAAVASWQDFAAGRGMPEWPLLTKLEISNVCNLKCAMCDTFSALNPSRLLRLGEVERGFLDVAQALEALDPLLRHTLAVRCSGLGEPTVHPRFREVVAGLSRFAVMVEFFTNGMLVDEGFAAFLVASGVHKVRFSLSGATRQDYEGVYLGGDFERVLAGIAGLARAKAAAASPYPIIGINSLAFRHHLATLEDFVTLMAAHGVEDICVQPLQEHGAIPALAGHAGVLGEAVGRAQVRAAGLGVVLTVVPSAPVPSHTAPAVPVSDFPSLARSVVAARPAGAGDPLPRLDPERGDADYLRVALDLEPAEGSPLCLMPFEEIYIRRNGDLKPCCHADKQGVPLGTLARQDGGTLWRGHGFSAVREAMLAGLVPNAVCRSCHTPKTRSSVPAVVEAYNAWCRNRHGIAPLPSGLAAPSAAGAVGQGRFQGDADTNRRAKQAFARPALARPDEAVFLRVEGCFDRVSRTGAEGWAWVPLCPGQRLQCSAWLDGRPLAQGLADLYRGDLEAAGKGDGRHAYGLAFAAPLPADADLSAIQVRIEVSGQILARFSPSVVAPEAAQA